MSFELEFRGALWRYLKREGHDVYRIDHYWVGTESNYDLILTVDYVDNSGMLQEEKVYNFTLRDFLEEL